MLADTELFEELRARLGTPREASSGTLREIGPPPTVAPDTEALPPLELPGAGGMAAPVDPVSGIPGLDLDSRSLIRACLDGLSARPPDCELDLPDALLDYLRTFLRPMVSFRFERVEASLCQAWTQRLDRAGAVLRRASLAVGRIRLCHHPYLHTPGCGTLVGPRLLATPRHVAATFVHGGGAVPAWRTSPDGVQVQAEVRLGQTPSSTRGDRVEVEAVAWLAPDRPGQPELALLRLSPTTVGGAALPAPLALRREEPAPGTRVAVVGLLDGEAGAGRAAAAGAVVCPGRLLTVSASSLAHDCSVPAGLWGAALVELEDGAVLGLHLGGRPGQVGWALPLSPCLLEHADSGG